MTVPHTVTTLALLKDACAHLQQFGVIEGRIAPDIIATAQFDATTGQFGLPRTWHPHDVLAPVRLVDAGPDALRRLLRLCDLIERVNAGGGVFAYEIEDLWWKAPAMPSSSAEVLVSEMGAAS